MSDWSQIHPASSTTTFKHIHKNASPSKEEQGDAAALTEPCSSWSRSGITWKAADAKTDYVYIHSKIPTTYVIVKKTSFQLFTQFPEKISRKRPKSPLKTPPTSHPPKQLKCSLQSTTCHIAQNAEHPFWFLLPPQLFSSALKLLELKACDSVSQDITNTPVGCNSFIDV